MKNPSLKLCLFLLTQIWSSHTQIGTEDFKSTINNGFTKWSIIVESEFTYSIEWIVGKDTVLNSQNYKCLYFGMGFRPFPLEENVPYNEQWRDFMPFKNWDEFETVYLRESVDHSQVYMYDKEINEEYLVADYSLQKGDTFYLPKYADLSTIYPQNTFPFDIVDTVYYENNLKFIQFKYNQLSFPTDSPKFTFIESVGSNAGVCYAWKNHPFYHNWGALLNCYTNDSVFYKNKKIPFDCGYEWANNLFETELTNPYIYYNSKTIEVYIEGESMNCMLFDNSGRFIRNILSDNGILYIETSAYKPGIYILRIFSDTKQLNFKIKI